MIPTNHAVARKTAHKLNEVASIQYVRVVMFASTSKQLKMFDYSNSKNQSQFLFR